MKEGTVIEPTYTEGDDGSDKVLLLKLGLATLQNRLLDASKSPTSVLRKKATISQVSKDLEIDRVALTHYVRWAVMG